MKSNWTLGLVVMFLMGWTASEYSYAIAPPSNLDHTDGERMGRIQIDRFIQTTSAMEIDAVLNSLNENGETYSIVSSASRSSSVGSCYIKQVLADRRALRIFQYLSEKDADVASTESAAIFDEKLRLLANDWGRLTSAKSVSYDNLAALGPDHHAASIALFFCSFFCAPEILDQKMKDWDDAMDLPKFEKIEGDQFLKVHRCIDPLFRLNILLISGRRNGADVGGLELKITALSPLITGGKSSFLKVKDLKLFKWNAAASDTHFVYMTRGVPASENAVLLILPGFTELTADVYLQNPQTFSLVRQTIDQWRFTGRITKNDHN